MPGIPVNTSKSLLSWSLHFSGRRQLINKQKAQWVLARERHEQESVSKKGHVQREDRDLLYKSWF